MVRGRRPRREEVAPLQARGQGLRREGAGPDRRRSDRREEGRGRGAQLRARAHPDRRLLRGRAPDVRGRGRQAHPVVQGHAPRRGRHLQARCHTVAGIHALARASDSKRLPAARPAQGRPSPRRSPD